MNDIGAAHDNWRLRDGAFDELHGILRAGGRTTQLDRSCLALLTLLLRHAGTPVGKERLLEAGWPATIVHENSLAKAIGRLRDALGDDADLLKAVYGIGYKLDASILARPDAAIAPPTGAVAVEPEPEPAGGGRRRVLALGAIAAALAALLIPAVALQQTPTPEETEAQFRRTPPVIADAPDAIGKILWVDDHPENNIYEKQFFEKHRIAVHPVTNSDDALKLLQMYDYDAVISDMGRGDDRLAGPRMVQQMRARNDRTPVVIYTVRADAPAKQEAQRNLVAESGAQALAVTPQDVRTIVLRLFTNPQERESD
jgi:DNA-binding response OmpR family regulator